MNKALNSIKMLIFTALLGAVVGGVIWCFLKAVSVCTGLLWEELPKLAGFRLLPVIICMAGGLLLGLIHKRFGNYPEELPEVLSKVKNEKHYDYKPMGTMLVCAFLPLIIGASVGPEAGLTGVIAGLCYWIGDNVKYAREHTAEFSEIGEAVTLGELFHMPLFGIIAVEEENRNKDTGTIELPKTSKLLLYTVSAAGGFFSMMLFNKLFGAASEGFPSFSSYNADRMDYALILLYMAVGVLLCFFFGGSERLADKLAERIPPVIREVVCGAIIGIFMIFLPITLFSGEEEMRELMGSYGSYAPGLLLICCLVKLFLTALCIRLGLKGGHFFPVIFSCVMMGYALSMFIFGGGAGEHAVFAAGIITASALGAQLKKPFSAAILLLLCFPVSMLLWLLLAAAAGSYVRGIFSKREEKKAGRTEKKLS